MAKRKEAMAKKGRPRMKSDLHEKKWAVVKAGSAIVIGVSHHVAWRMAKQTNATVTTAAAAQRLTSVI